MSNNVLFIGVGKDGIPASIVQKLIEKCKIKNAYATVFESKDAFLFNEAVNIWDAYYGKYPAINDIKPIDRAYKNPIAQYSVEILHQIARHGNWDFEKRLNLYYSHLRYWDNFLETKKVNYVIFAGLPHESYDYIVYLLCKNKKIKTCMSFIDGYKYRVTEKAHYMLESLDNHAIEADFVFRKLKNKYEDMSEEDILLPEYTERDIRNIKARFENAENSSKALMGKGRMEEIKRYYGNPIESLKDVKKGEKTFKNLIRTWRVYNRGVRLTKKLIKKYESVAVEPNFADKYLFYALHYQPEASSSPLGGIYANQLLAIQLIVHNLPEGYWLYVKEHPDQTAFCRELSYYEELAKIPKIKIISQKVTSERLMKHAAAMVTLTGTVMFESQIIQKPCLCFGYTPLEILDGVYKINTNEDCKNAIDEIINKRPKTTLPKDLRLYLLAMEEICFSKKDEIEFYNKLLQYIELA